MLLEWEQVTDRKELSAKIEDFEDKGRATHTYKSDNPNSCNLGHKTLGKVLGALNQMWTGLGFFHLSEQKPWRNMLVCPYFQQTFEQRKGSLEDTKYVTSWSISSCKVSSLNHEVFDHTMKFTSFVSISSLRKWNNSLNECNIQFYIQS